MDIVIKCNCGNKAELLVDKGKMLTLCDNIEYRDFRLSVDKKTNRQMTELRVHFKKM